MARIKRFGILRMSSFMGLYSVFIGLIFALLAGLLFSIISSIFASGGDYVIQNGGPAELANSGIGNPLSFSWFYLVLFPIIFGAFGFVSGLILTPIINLTLKAIGGIDLDLDFQEYHQQPQQVYRPSPPPQYSQQQSRY